MEGNLFIAVRLALVMACTSLFASQASAGCFTLTDIDSSAWNMRFSLCDEGESKIRLNAKEIGKHPAITAAPSGEIAVSIQSASVNIEAVNARWLPRAPYYVFLDHDEAFRLAKAVNAGEAITITASKMPAGETYTIFSGVFELAFPAELLSPDAEKQAAAPAAPPAPKKAEQKPFPDSDLPTGLTSVTLIPFEAGKEDEWREAYLATFSGDQRRFINRSCEATAYPYRRAHAYWHRVDHDLERVNPGAPYQLTRESAASLCADEHAAAEFRSQLLHHPKDTFDGLCEVMRSPASYQISNMGLVHETACYDLTAIRDYGDDQCMRSYLPDKSEAEREDYCNCVGEKQAEYFTDGTKKIRSTTLVEASTRARGACKNSAAAQQTTSSSVPKATPPVKPVPKPAPAKAEPASTADGLEEEAVKAIDEAADKIKEGLGSLFD